MSVNYRRDPETGKTFAFGGLIGVRTIDDRRTEREDFTKLLIRRAPEIHHNDHRLSPVEHLALEEDIWGSTAWSGVASDSEECGPRRWD